VAYANMPEVLQSDLAPSCRGCNALIACGALVSELLAEVSRLAAGLVCARLKLLCC
jgi:hypothetical protein